MKNELIKLADHLDSKGMHKEANYLDTLIKESAGGSWDPQQAKAHRDLINLFKRVEALELWKQQVESGLEPGAEGPLPPPKQPR
jgi:hypothetical protein